MTGNRNQILTKFEQMGEENVRSAIALGKYGGRARTKKLTPERRREIAKKAAKARWNDKAPS